MSRRKGVGRPPAGVTAILMLLLCTRAAHADVNRWSPRGPEGASVLSVAVDPTRPDVVYAGADSSLVSGYGIGVAKSVDGGRSWQASGSGLPADAIQQILIDPANPDGLFAVTRPGDARVFASTNGGALWEPVTGGAQVYCLAAGRNGARTVLYAGTNGHGVLKSTDSGASWAASGLDGHTFFAAFVDSGNPATAYVSARGAEPDSFRTSDGGATWQKLPGVAVLAMDPGHPAILYAHGQGTIVKSSDSGASWSPTGFGPVDVSSVEAMAVDPSDGNRLYLSTPYSFWKTRDGGTTWSKADNAQAYDFVASLAFDPRDSHVLYAGRFLSGVYRSSDQGESFQASNHGLFLTSAITLKAGAGRGGPLYTNDSCGLDRSDDGGRTWCCVAPGLDGGVVAVDPTDPLTVYAPIRVGDAVPLQRSRDGGISWAPLGAAAGQSLVAFDPTDPPVLYAVYPGLLRSADGGQTWTSISDGLPYAPTVSARVGPPLIASDQVTSVAVDPQSPSTLYAASHHCLYGPNLYCQDEASALSKSLDTGASWSPIPLPAGVTYLSHVQIPPADPGTIYVLSDYGGVFRSRDDGRSWTLVRATLELIFFDPSNPSTLYGLERGAVLRSTDGGSTWLPFGDGLENHLVNNLVVDPTGVVLRAATLGGGVQEYQFGTPVATLSTAPGQDFLVSLAARDQRTGRTSAGLAVQHTDDFAWFSLPGLTASPDNPEVFVKVVDGRAVNGTFWVFYGGLTDVEYTVSVTQQSSSSSKTYSKPAGSACGAFDTAAFPDSSAPAPSTAAAAACTPEPQLLLSPGRTFTVRLSATDPRTGRTTDGVAATENDSFGSFSLPAFTGNLSNPEVFVKILDGRPVNGHFWVFYGGLTDVEYSLLVTDGITGEGRTYLKPAGSSCGGFDVATFAE